MDGDVEALGVRAVRRSDERRASSGTESGGRDSENSDGQGEER